DIDEIEQALRVLGKTAADLQQDMADVARLRQERAQGGVLEARAAEADARSHLTQELAEAKRLRDEADEREKAAKDDVRTVVRAVEVAVTREARADELARSLRQRGIDLPADLAFARQLPAPEPEIAVAEHEPKPEPLPAVDGRRLSVHDDPTPLSEMPWCSSGAQARRQAEALQRQRATAATAATEIEPVGGGEVQS
ncbi:MAG: hypothetical protein KDE27_06490, partial [Planctomycetes bacterium]|nr:hypothetical protein [Planctomycetota bacterium]